MSILEFLFVREQISWLKESGIGHISLSFYVSGYEWDSDRKSALFSLFLPATENKTF